MMDPHNQQQQDLVEYLRGFVNNLYRHLTNDRSVQQILLQAQNRIMELIRLGQTVQNSIPSEALIGISAGIASTTDFTQNNLTSEVHRYSSIATAEYGLGIALNCAALDGRRLYGRLANQQDFRDDLEIINFVNFLRDPDVVSHLRFIATSAASSALIINALESLPMQVAFDTAFENVANYVGVPDALLPASSAIRGAIFGGLLAEIFFAHGLLREAVPNIRADIRQIAQAARDGVNQFFIQHQVMPQNFDNGDSDLDAIFDGQIRNRLEPTAQEDNNLVAQSQDDDLEGQFDDRPQNYVGGAPNSTVQPTNHGQNQDGSIQRR